MQCKICQQELKQITGTHLKRHNITVSEYKENFGPVVSDDLRKLKSQQSAGVNNPNFGKKMTDATKLKISKANTGKVAHNKGKPMCQAQKNELSAKAIARNADWRESNTHPVTGTKRSEETKEKIKQARAKQIIKPAAIQKALQTKRDNNYDFAFFRGRSHSKESRAKISASSIRNNIKRTKESIDSAEIRLKEYGYTLVDVLKNIVNIECNKCKNNFRRTRQYTTPSKINKNMCPTCYPVHSCSAAEREVADFLKQYTSVESNRRDLITPQEIDIYLPNYAIGIEYNGLYWHSEIFKDSKYHASKTEQCNAIKIHLVHIFEDEWKNNKEIVKSRLLNLIGKTENILHGRKTKIQTISSAIANKFLKDNHIQGSGRANVHIGLFDAETLVAVMTFLKGDISKRVSGWELNRFCTKLNTSVVGGASKLFKYFVIEYDPVKITSFADKRWSAGAFYTNLGFTHEHDSPPNYWYFLPGEVIRHHRYKLRKPPKSLITERELRSSEGYLRIYDCGSEKYEWKK